MSSPLLPLLTEIRGCTHCAEHLPLGPRPVLSAAAGARIAIVGQAPGTKVHASGVPWDDDSGEHLRDWLEMEISTFYDPQQVAIIPMGFCYPGRRKGGDAPPRPECAPLWHERLFSALPAVRLTLLVGMYAQKHYLGATRKKTLTATVRAWRDYGPAQLPTPHPSWRSRLFMKKNPWFEEELLPDLRQRVRAALR